MPRNRRLPSNRDPRRFDLGLCATAAAKGWPDGGQWCGYFRTPGLRNVAARERYMHNGVFDDLRAVVAWYGTRAIEAERWYADGVLFDDVPARYRSNINMASMPYSRRKGMTSALSEDDIDAIVAFLQTLTDAPFEAAARKNMQAQALRRTTPVNLAVSPAPPPPTR